MTTPKEKTAALRSSTSKLINADARRFLAALHTEHPPAIDAVPERLAAALIRAVDSILKHTQKENYLGVDLRRYRTLDAKIAWLKERLPLQGWTVEMLEVVPTSATKKRGRPRSPKVSEDSPKTKRVRAPVTCRFDGCDMVLTGQDNRLAHERTMHSMHGGESKYFCRIPSCSRHTKAFPKKFNRNTHENKHIGLRIFKCDMCSEVFPQQANIKRHKMKMHNVACSVCSKKFVNKTDLPQHFKDEHPDADCAALAIRNFKTACDHNLTYSNCDERNAHEDSCEQILQNRAILAQAKAEEKAREELSMKSPSTSKKDPPTPQSDGSQSSGASANAMPSIGQSGDDHSDVEGSAMLDADNDTIMGGTEDAHLATIAENASNLFSSLNFSPSVVRQITESRAPLRVDTPLPCTFSFVQFDDSSNPCATYGIAPAIGSSACTSPNPQTRPAACSADSPLPPLRQPHLLGSNSRTQSSASSSLFASQLPNYGDDGPCSSRNVSSGSAPLATTTFSGNNSMTGSSASTCAPTIGTSAASDLLFSTLQSTLSSSSPDHAYGRKSSTFQKHAAAHLTLPALREQTGITLEAAGHTVGASTSTSSSAHHTPYGVACATDLPPLPSSEMLPAPMSCESFGPTPSGFPGGRFPHESASSAPFSAPASSSTHLPPLGAAFLPMGSRANGSMVSTEAASVSSSPFPHPHELSSEMPSASPSFGDLPRLFSYMRDGPSTAAMRAAMDCVSGDSQQPE